MQYLILILLALPAFLFAGSTAVSSTTIADTNSTKYSRAAWIVLEGDVDQGMADYAKRAIEEAIQQSPDVIVFEINTFGGLLHAAFEIVDTITAIKSVPTIAFVDQKAISAGALIALSADQLYMKPATTIGDCAPILQGEGGPQILGEKIQSPLRAKFRNLAQRNGHPELLSEAMVTPELEVLELVDGDSSIFMDAKDYEDLTDAQKKQWDAKRVVVREGELLTMTEVEAEALGFSLGTYNSNEEFKTAMGITEITEVEISWSEELARWLAAISPLLMMLAFGALYLEYQTPGFGIFGIIGISLIAIVVAGQYVSGLADQLPLILLMIGIVLALVEVFIFPGTWMAGIASVLFLGGALVSAISQSDTGIPAPQLPGVTLDQFSWALTQVIGSALLGLLVPLLATRYLLPRLPEGATPILQGSLTGQAPSEGEESLAVGMIGESMTLLKPTGKARFGAQSHEVECLNGFLESHQAVRIVHIVGRRIEVVPHQENV